MKYVIVGSGGTGGAIGGFMSKAGKDVTLIARGEHLRQMQSNGLQFETLDGNYSVPVKACTMDEYHDIADVVFICVKGYSLEDTVPFIERITNKHSVVIPILNIYGTGRQLQEKLPGTFVTDGCIYIAAEIKCPGTILLSGKIFRVVYGLRKDTPAEICEKLTPILKQVEEDLAASGITPLFSDFIEKDALQKFSFVSPMAALGASHDIPAKPVQQEGEMRELFKALIQEIRALSMAMEAPLPENIVEINLKIMDDLVPTATASMQRDIKAGKQSEVDGLVYQVVRYGEQYGVPTPVYAKLANMLRTQLN